MYAALALQFAKADAQSQCLADMAPQRVGEGTRRREANGGVGAPDADPRHRTGWPAQGQLARELSAAVGCSAYAAMSKPGYVAALPDQQA